MAFLAADRLSPQPTRSRAARTKTPTIVLRAAIRRPNVDGALVRSNHAMANPGVRSCIDTWRKDAPYAGLDPAQSLHRELLWRFRGGVGQKCGSARSDPGLNGRGQPRA